MGSQEIRIVIFHRNRLLRQSIAFVLAQQPSLSVVDDGAQLHHSSAELVALNPGLFILDFGPEREGLQETRRIRALSSEHRVLLIDVPNNEADVMACIECGASGYLHQDASIENLISNTLAVSAGEALCSARIAALAFSKLSQLASQSQVSASHVGPLTRRELEIVASIEKGLSNKEIALQLGIEVSTVKNHVHNILNKLQMQNRRSAAQYLKEHGRAAYLR